MVGAELNDMWRPRTVEFVDALPLTRANKIDKKALRARYAAAHPAGRDRWLGRERRAGGSSRCSSPTSSPCSAAGCRCWRSRGWCWSPPAARRRWASSRVRRCCPTSCPGCWPHRSRTGSVSAAPRSSRTRAARSPWRASPLRRSSGSGALLVLVALAGATRGLGDRVKHVMLRPLAEAAGIKVIRVTSAYEGFSRTAMLLGSAAGGLLIAWVGATGRDLGGRRVVRVVRARRRCAGAAAGGRVPPADPGHQGAVPGRAARRVPASCGATTCCPA